MDKIDEIKVGSTDLPSREKFLTHGRPFQDIIVLMNVADQRGKNRITEGLRRIIYEMAGDSNHTNKKGDPDKSLEEIDRLLEGPYREKVLSFYRELLEPGYMQDQVRVDGHMQEFLNDPKNGMMMLGQALNYIQDEDPEGVRVIKALIGDIHNRVNQALQCPLLKGSSRQEIIEAFLSGEFKERAAQIYANYSTRLYTG